MAGLKPPDRVNADPGLLEPPPKISRHVARGVLTQVCKWLLFAAVLYFVGRVLVRQLAEITWSEFRLHVPLMVAAFLIYWVARAQVFLAYGLLLGRFARRPGWRVMMAAVWMSQLGKYLPGKIGTVVGMSWLLRRHRVPVPATVTTAAVVDGLSVILGLMVAIPLALSETLRPRIPGAWVWCAVFLAAGLICLHPKVLGAASGFALRKLGMQPFERAVRFRDYLGPCVVLLVQFALMGLALWLMTRSLTDVSLSALPIFMAAMAVAETIGFVSFFAPAGLGVMEGVLWLILAPVVPKEQQAQAAVVVVAIRLAKTLADAFGAAVGAGVFRFSPAASPAPD